MPSEAHTIALSNHGPNQQAWLLDPKRQPREIIEFIQASAMDSHTTHLARNVLALRIAEIADASSLRMERHTTKLVHLTYVLAALTLGLLVLEVAHYCGH